MTDSVLRTAETTSPAIRPFMNWIDVLSGTSRRCRISWSLYRQDLRTAPTHPQEDHQTHEQGRGGHRGENADADGDGEALHRARAEDVEQQHLDQCREIGIDDGRESAREAGVECRHRRAAV